MGRLGWWIWGESRQVTVEWLEQHRVAVDGPEFIIEGHSFEKLTNDENNDGTPDMGWTKGDILAWMEDNGVNGASSLSTKKKLLGAINAHLNPPEESINEAEEADNTGDE